jgi:hypothetical protein
MFPSAKQLGSQFYWKIVCLRMSQKIAKKHYEEVKTDNISSHKMQHTNAMVATAHPSTSSGFWPNLITHQADCPKNSDPSSHQPTLVYTNDNQPDVITLECFGYALR